MEETMMNRELSWLDFNARVLSLANDKSVPLAERLKFIAIFCSNLDEFFMVRVGSLYERTLLQKKSDKDINELQKYGMTPIEQLNVIMPKAKKLQTVCDLAYESGIQEISNYGFTKVDFTKLDKDSEYFWKKYFKNELLPVLSPQILDNRHPFPFLRNKEVYLAVQLKQKTGEPQTFGLVPISSQTERVIFINTKNGFVFALVEELISHFSSVIFGKDKIEEQCLFRVTRNADLTVQEGMMDHDIDYRSVMSEILKKRRKLAAVRLQFSLAAPQNIVNFLCDKLLLPHSHCFMQSSSLDLSFLFKVAGKISGANSTADLFYPPARPMMPPAEYKLSDVVQERDVLLCYPYQSIRPFIALLRDAASDPKVVSIKMTLYRMADNSQIVRALTLAAENNKEVMVLVELRARFDEQNNIDWSKQLEAAGCTVIYGHDAYKVHSKLTLITKRSDGRYSHITQIGTGNYNEKTSEIYTDLSYITSNQEIGEEASAVFQKLAFHKLTDRTTNLLVAPRCFKSILLDEMDRLIMAANSGRKTSMVLKNNSMNDKELMAKMCEASMAGVRVDLIIRGICCLNVGVQGKSENIHVRSLVGRYLEHSRIYSFDDGIEKHVYIASGDFLTRNTECRVEVGIRITAPELVKKIEDILYLQLNDNVNAFEMQSDGSYTKVQRKDGEKIIDAQMDMFKILKNDWQEHLLSLPIHSAQEDDNAKQVVIEKETICEPVAKTTQKIEEANVQQINQQEENKVNVEISNEQNETIPEKQTIPQTEKSKENTLEEQAKNTEQVYQGAAVNNPTNVKSQAKPMQTAASTHENIKKVNGQETMQYNTKTNLPDKSKMSFLQRIKFILWG